jgi:hypothetical protein
MIKANELRIGNFVLTTKTNLNPDRWIKITVNSDNINTAQFNPEWFKGIPITKARFKKLGFVYDIGFRWKHVDDNPHSLYFNLNIMGFELHHFSNFARLRHVHELQNLYFALTKIELEVKGKL